jgi:hypothetical protein
MRVSHSRVKTWRRCPNQYRYKYVMGLKPRERKTQLERGSWLHELLMVHYDGEDWRLRHRALKKQFMNLFEEEREQLGDLPTECFRIMKSYERTYKFDDEGDFGFGITRHASLLWIVTFFFLTLSSLFTTTRSSSWATRTCAAVLQMSSVLSLLLYLLSLITELS